MAYHCVVFPYPAFETRAEGRAFMTQYQWIHAAWVERYADDASFDPAAEGSDYPIHHVSVDCTEEQCADLEAHVDELIRTWPERWAQIQAARADSTT